MKKVITYGTYDLFHQGHYSLLKRAKALGDYLIVGVTSEYFNKCRGKFNVQDSLMTRIENVKATGFADEIVVEEYFGQKIDDVKEYNIDIFAIGSDWIGHFDYLSEYCRVVYLERTKGISSTQLRNAHNQRLGIIGSEEILPRFIDEMKYVSGVEIAGILPSQKSIAARYSELASFQDYQQLLSEVDAVYINLPLSQRFLYIKQALQAGKHVLTEFPFCQDYDQAKQTVDLAIKKNIILMEGLKTAYCPAFCKLISLVKSGLIGRILNVEARFTQILGEKLTDQVRLAGGSVTSLGAYPLLAIFKLFGTDFKDIQFLSHMENGIDVFTKMNIIYENAVASGTVAINAKSEGNLVITGTKGYVYVPAPWWKTELFEVRYEDMNRNNKYFYKFEGEGLRYELVEFVRSINEKRTDNIWLTNKEILASSKVMDLFLQGFHRIEF